MAFQSFFLSQLAPKLLSSSVFSTCASLVLNHLLDQQPSGQSTLQRCAGKVLFISVPPVSIVLRVSDQGHFQALNNHEFSAQADTEIHMQWAHLVGALGKPSALVRKARIQGDMEFAQTLSGVINALSWDAEGDLARVVGDVQAVWIMNALTALGTNLHDVWARFKSNVHDYVVHEQAMLPTQSELEAFGQGVAGLRDDLARLEKRIERLHVSLSQEGNTP